jgi:hypothetical protein
MQFCITVVAPQAFVLLVVRTFVKLPAAAFQALASKFDWSRYNTLGDFGGSAGVLCCCVAAAQPHMSCTTHDLPAVHGAAVQYARQQGLTDRVKVSCELIVWQLCFTLLSKCRKAGRDAAVRYVQQQGLTDRVQVATWSGQVAIVPMGCKLHASATCGN